MDQTVNNINEVFKVIPRVLAFIEKEDEILLIERAKKDAFAFSKWNGIGGHVEKGEDPLSAIRREVKEECGLDIYDFTLHVIVYIDIEQEVGISLFVFSAVYNGQSIKPSEEGNLQWVKQKDIASINIVKDIPDLLKTLNESKRNCKIKFLLYDYKDKELFINKIN